MNGRLVSLQEVRQLHDTFLKANVPVPSVVITRALEAALVEHDDDTIGAIQNNLSSIKIDSGRSSRRLLNLLKIAETREHTDVLQELQSKEVLLRLQRGIVL